MDVKTMIVYEMSETFMSKGNSLAFQAEIGSDWQQAG